jgi:hypothetical protein
MRNPNNTENQRPYIYGPSFIVFIKMRGRRTLKLEGKIGLQIDGWKNFSIFYYFLSFFQSRYEKYIELIWKLI